MAARRRSRQSAKAAGSRFERELADYLATHVDDRIDRRVKTGAKDKGDLAGVRLAPALGGGRVTVECKNTATTQLSLHREAEAERLNDDAVVALLAHKRHGVGAPGQQWITCTVDDLIALLTGRRPVEPECSTDQ